MYLTGHGQPVFIIQDLCFWVEFRFRFKVGHLESNTIINDTVSQDINRAPQIKLLEKALNDTVFDIYSMDGLKLFPLVKLGIFQKSNNLFLIEG